MSLIFAAVLFAAVGTAKTPAPAPSSLPASTTASTSASAEPIENAEYRIGAGDVLDITVIGDQDLSRPSAVVQTNGTVTLPLLGEVPVAALTVPEVKTKLTHLLARDYLRHPQVEVKIREYQSQFVTVLGEVNSPGKKALRGQTRLYEILTEAAGFRPNASGELVISRIDGTFSGGEKALRVRINTSAPTAQDMINFNVVVRHGDLITALPKYYVVIDGEVSRPARYVLEPDLTVTGLVAMAGGLTRWAKSDLKIVRRSDPASGKVEIIEVDYKAVRKGKKPDVTLQPNDHISVGRRLF